MRSARDEFVVMDTAPTGHTLLLLDTAGSYHRQLTQQVPAGGVRIQTPLMRLQDPNYTRILIVTLPETTPVYWRPARCRRICAWHVLSRLPGSSMRVWRLLIPKTRF